MQFEKLPTNLTELQASPYASLQKPEYAAGLFVAAMCTYPQDVNAALEMVKFLKGPDGLSVYQQQFLRDRMQGADYKPRSFFKGATPDNNYTPTQPYEIEFTTTPYSFKDENRAVLYCKSGGADSPRAVHLRLKPSTGQWFLEDQMLLGDIRIPKAADPWA